AVRSGQRLGSHATTETDPLFTRSSPAARRGQPSWAAVTLFAGDASGNWDTVGAQSCFDYGGGQGRSGGWGTWGGGGGGGRLCVGLKRGNLILDIRGMSA